MQGIKDVEGAWEEPWSIGSRWPAKMEFFRCGAPGGRARPPGEKLMSQPGGEGGG